MMQSPGPINNRVRLVFIQPYRTADASTGVQLTKLKESIKDGTILPYVEPLELTNVILHVIGGDDAKEVDVVVRVEARHGGGGYVTGAEYFHAPVEAVVND